MFVSNVLQVNVRLSEGGAAGVARTLADELRKRGTASPFAYGYSTGGRSSPREALYDAIRITPAPIAAANRASYSLIGRETRLVGKQRWTSFIRAIDAADVVHLHAIHSHIVDTPVLFRALIEAKKPVVWTLHDQWAMTGRCAQPGACRLWETGCVKCPDLGAYPPARVDNAKRRWAERRDLIAELQASVPTSIIACANWLADEARKSSLRDVGVITNSVDAEFWDATTHPRGPNDRAVVRNVFICRDLRDTRKVAWNVLKRLAQLPGQTLTIVGDNAPEQFGGVRWIPAIMNRHDFALEMLNQDRLVFTSQIDYFPLTIVEALTAGLEVFALDSQAAREFRDTAAVRVFDSAASLIASVAEPTSINRSSTSSRDRSQFAPSRMTDDYMAVYERLIRG